MHITQTEFISGIVTIGVCAIAIGCIEIDIQALVCRGCVGVVQAKRFARIRPGRTIGRAGDIYPEVTAASIQSDRELLRWRSQRQV